MLAPVLTPPLTPPILEFPDSDGKPMGETGIHVMQSYDLYGALRRYFQRQGRVDVYIGANMFMYFDPADPMMNICPDVFVALGVAPQGERRTWKTWEEGKMPDVIFEITSKSTRRVDVGEKKSLYGDLGVREYFLFDPLAEYLHPPLQGCRYTLGGPQPFQGSPQLSEVLGLELHIKDDDRLHLFDPGASEWLLTTVELIEHEAKVEARAEQEAARAEAAEAENARLREELARLKGTQK